MPEAQRELTFLLTDLYLAADLRASLAETLADAPALPALERIIARASAREGGDWRSLALTLTDTEVAGPVPVAALSRAATPRAAPAAGQWWVASAVHLRAAHDHVQLGEVLALSTAEWEQVVGGFNAAFGAQSGTLELGHGTEAYLRAANELDAQGVDPERVAGCDVHDFLPGGADGSAVRRLMTEVQMWLHDHPLNLARETRGVPSVSGLWLWGAGELPALSVAASLPALVTEDRFLRGLWSLRSGSAAPAGDDSPRPAAPSAIATFDAAQRLAAENPRGCVVGLALRDQPGTSWLQRLAAIDSDWLAPALSLLRAGRVDAVRLQAGAARFTLRARDLWRIWRRQRSWVEAIA